MSTPITTSPKVARDWRDRGFCTGTPSMGLNDRITLAESFAPPFNERTLPLVRVACHHCPVRESCLESSIVEAINKAPDQGIRGGLTEAERRPMIQARIRTLQAAADNQNGQSGRDGRAA